MELSSPDSRRSPPVAGTDRPTDRPTQRRGSHCPVPLILASDVAPRSSFPFLHPLESPKPRKPSLPLCAGGESRSTLGTIRGLGGASVAAPGGGRGGVGAGVGGRKVQGNSGAVSCWGGEGRRVGVKPWAHPHLPVPAILPGTLRAGGGCWTQVVVPGSARAWLCMGRSVRATGASLNPVISQDPVAPLQSSPLLFRVQGPHP